MTCNCKDKHLTLNAIGWHCTICGTFDSKEETVFDVWKKVRGVNN